MFDCDGLLVDSGRCWERAYGAIADAHGRLLAELDLAALVGASVAGAREQLSRNLGADVDETALRRALGDAFSADPPTELPGARALVQALAVHVPLAVASNAPRDIVLGVLDRLGLRQAFTAVVSAEETLAHKPAPDVYLEACSRLDVAPCDAIAFEDSPPGARAARAAGLIVVAVPSAPRMAIEADLVVPRLDDHRLGQYLGLRIAQTTRRPAQRGVAGGQRT